MQSLDRATDSFERGDLLGRVASLAHSSPLTPTRTMFPHGEAHSSLGLEPPGLQNYGRFTVLDSEVRKRASVPCGRELWGPESLIGCL